MAGVWLQIELIVMMELADRAGVDDVRSAESNCLNFASRANI